MPSWFEDHLRCAPLGEWLPALLDDRSVWIDGGVAAPRALARLLASVPGAEATPARTVVHTGPLHAAPADGLDALARAADVVLDIAWVTATAGWMRLRPWRRAPMRDDVAARLGWITGLGLGAPQQWVCTHPLAVVVTVARARR
ncbi:MAG: hypothetical protein JNK45_03795 [Myxococcales bacterium]|nr:hypothetical protein [Myxococcales bacterium]